MTNDKYIYLCILKTQKLEVYMFIYILLLCHCATVVCTVRTPSLTASLPTCHTFNVACCLQSGLIQFYVFYFFKSNGYMTNRYISGLAFSGQQLAAVLLKYFDHFDPTVLQYKVPTTSQPDSVASTSWLSTTAYIWLSCCPRYQLLVIAVRLVSPE